MVILFFFSFSFPLLWSVRIPNYHTGAQVYVHYSINFAFVVVVRQMHFQNRFEGCRAEADDTVALANLTTALISLMTTVAVAEQDGRCRWEDKYPGTHVSMVFL